MLRRLRWGFTPRSRAPSHVASVRPPDASGALRTPRASLHAFTRAEQDAALREARAFYDEWSSIARAVITRRDHLILLGLATRRSPKPAGAPAPVTPIAPAADDADEDDRDA